jgi:hypothetical protein
MEREDAVLCAELQVMLNYRKPDFARVGKITSQVFVPLVFKDKLPNTEAVRGKVLREVRNRR